MTDERIYDAFLIYSSNDTNEARDVENKLKKSGIKVCVHERDFVPGLSIFDNISSAIIKSRKQIVIVSNSDQNTGLYSHEVDESLFNSLVPRKQNTIIVLVIGKATVPQKLNFNEVVIHYQATNWVDDLVSSIELPILFTKPEFPRENDYIVISVSAIDSEESDILPISELKQKVKQVQNIRIAKGKDVDHLRYEEDSKEEIISSIKAMEKILEITGETTTVLVLWVSQSFNKEDMCNDFLKSLKLSLKDRPRSPSIIPYLSRGSEPPDFIKDISCQYPPNKLTEDFFNEFNKCVARAAFMKPYVEPQKTDLGTNSKADIETRSNTNIFRVSEIEGVFEDEEQGSQRYLGVSFTGDGHLLLLDADNKCLKKVTIMGRPIKKLPFEKMPNRLSMIDDDHVAMIYRDTFEVLIICTKTMTIENTRKIKDEQGRETVLKGITAIDGDTMVVTLNGDKCSLNIALVRKENVLIRITTDQDGHGFSMPRRLTRVDENTVVVADEDDRRLTVVHYDANSEEALKVVYAQSEWKKELYNVRGLAAHSKTVYVAACNGVTTFNVEERALCKQPLITFRSNVLHTRALALYCSPSTQRKYLAVSLAQMEGESVKDVVKVFDVTA